jgi:arginase family enzyme
LWKEEGAVRAALPAPARRPVTTLMGAPECSADGLLGADLAVVGLPLGGWSEAPAAVRDASQRYSGWLSVAARDTGLRMVDYGDVAVDTADLAASLLRAHGQLADVFAAGATPLLLGGDAVVTVPALQVLAGKLRGRLGVIAFSPRLDLDLEPAHAGISRWARALELGVVEPNNFVVVGECGAPGEAGARRVCDRLGGRRYSLADVAEAGIVTVAREAIEAATAGTEAIYVSVDLSVVAGVADPVGLTPSDVSIALSIVGQSRLACADLCGVTANDADHGAPAAVAARLAAELVVAASPQRA